MIGDIIDSKLAINIKDSPYDGKKNNVTITLDKFDFSNYGYQVIIKTINGVEITSQPKSPDIPLFNQSFD